MSGRRAVSSRLSTLLLLCSAAGLAHGQAVLNVDGNATGPTHDGTSWCHAFTDLQQALAAAASGVTIRVADGTYVPDQGTGDRGATFRLISGVVLEGGYSGCGAVDPDQRDLVLYETILSGDLGGDDGPAPVIVFGACHAESEPVSPGCAIYDYDSDGDVDAHDLSDFVSANHYGDNSYHVVTGSDTDATAALDGFTITAGCAYPFGPNANGGGMFNEDGQATVTSCTYRGNLAAARGGGMYNDYSSSPAITQCTFHENFAVTNGGGMLNYSGSSPSVTKCVFHRNVSAFGGAIANLHRSSPTLVNCLFLANTGGWDGGGIHSSTNVSSPTLISCVFRSNTALNNGGAMFNADNSATVLNCTFSGNTAGNYGGGMINLNSTPTISSSILWGNSDGHGSGKAAQMYAGTPGIDYSCVEGWSGSLGGIGNTGNDPLFVDADGPDALSGTQDDDLRLAGQSTCIDEGDPAFVPAGGETDLDGHARVLCSRVDMGAYEFGMGDGDCDRAVGLKDFAGFQRCFTGSGGGPYADGCEAFDFDYNGDVGLVDWSSLQTLFTGV